VIPVSTVSTIHTVASSARVSTATVSRVINGSTSVAPLTRVRVLRAIARFRYTPNAVAKNLRTRRSARVLVWAPRLSNAYVPPLLDGIARVAAENGYSLLLALHAFGDAGRFARILSDREADGSIVLASSRAVMKDRRRLESLMDHERPCLMIAPVPRVTDRQLNAVGERCASALLDVIEGRSRPSAAALPSRGARWLTPRPRRMRPLPGSAI
jgi:DNA-binding LacI/PurR family transcriptional regulator